MQTLHEAFSRCASVLSQSSRPDDVAVQVKAYQLMTQGPVQLYETNIKPLFCYYILWKLFEQVPQKAEIVGLHVARVKVCTAINTRKLSYRKDDRVMHPVYGCTENFWVPEYAHGHCPEIFNGLLFQSILWMCVQNLKSVALPVPEIIRVIQTLGSSWIRPHSLFSKIFNGLLFRWTLWMYKPYLKFVALPIAIETSGGGCEPPILG